MATVTIQIDDFSMEDGDFDRLMVKAIREQILDNSNYKEKIEEKIRDYIEELLTTEILGTIRVKVDKATKAFVEEGLIIEDDRYSKEDIKFEKYFKQALEKKYKFGKEGQLNPDSYGQDVISLVTSEGIMERITGVLDEWIAENEEVVRDNISTIVSNNIQTQLFGKSLPDRNLMKIASPNLGKPDDGDTED